jgi:hypothetical protein
MFFVRPTSLAHSRSHRATCTNSATLSRRPLYHRWRRRGQKPRYMAQARLAQRTYTQTEQLWYSCLQAPGPQCISRAEEVQPFIFLTMWRSVTFPHISVRHLLEDQSIVRGRHQKHARVCSIGPGSIGTDHATMARDKGVVTVCAGKLRWATVATTLFLWGVTTTMNW